MGILDEAIREHLALKRRQGFSDDEIKRLEDEAFGPPARPGKESPGNGGGADEGAGAAQGAEGREGPSAPVAAGEPEPRAEGQKETEPPTREAETARATGEDESGGFYDFARDLEAGAEETAQAPAAGRPPIESLETVEHRIEDAVDESPSEEQADEQPSDEQPSDEQPSDEHAYEQPESGEQAVYEPESDESSYEPESDEYRYEPETGEEDAEATQARGDQADEGDSGELEASAQGQEGDEGEDVLEETPDFLRDAPEDDELWFEQGEPKDFDF